MDGAQTYATSAFDIAQQLNSDAYIGAAYGNLAWLDYRDGHFSKAEMQAKEALTTWGDYQYPFKWLSHWVLVAIYLDHDELDRAVQSVRVLLDPKQQRLPDDVTAALEQSLQNWKVGKIDSAGKALIKAVELAKQRGYL